jgi:hypothetical protein
VNIRRLGEIHNVVPFPGDEVGGQHAGMDGTTLDDQIATVVKRLGPTVALDPDRLEAEVRACFADWDDARVREFVPIFVERTLRGKLGLSSRQTSIAS